MEILKPHEGPRRKDHLALTLEPNFFSQSRGLSATPYGSVSIISRPVEMSVLKIIENVGLANLSRTLSSFTNLKLL